MRSGVRSEPGKGREGMAVLSCSPRGRDKSQNVCMQHIYGLKAACGRDASPLTVREG